MQELLIGIDVGSTNIKVVAFDIHGNIVFSENRPMKDFYHIYSGKRYVYADQDYVYGAVIDMLLDITGKAADRYTVCALAVTGMGDDGIPLGADNKPIYPFISWKCKRTLDAYESFKKEFGFDNYFCITGLQARNMDTIFKFMWMRENEPEIYAKITKWLFIEDYICYKLCGEMVTEPSIATTSGMLDLAKNEWSQELCDYVGFNKEALPEFIRGGQKIGAIKSEVSRLTGLPEGVPIIMGGWDIQCAAIVLGGLKPDYVVDTMGTWETVNIIAEKPILTKDFYKRGFHVCNHIIEGLYTYPVFLLSSRIVEWYLDSFYGEVIDKSEKYSVFMNDAARARCGAGGAMFLPHLSGSYFPQIDPCSFGAFLGVTEQTGKAEFSRALLEGLTYMTSQVIYTCEELLGKNLEEIIVTGGGVRNPVWMEIKASVLNRNLLISETAEDTALGAAMLAGVGCGIYKDVNDAQSKMVGTAKTLKPRTEQVAIYKNKLKIFDGLYYALKSTNEKISESVYDE